MERRKDFDQGPIAYLNFLDWQRDSQTFSFMDQDYSLIGTGDGERVRGYMISNLGLRVGRMSRWGHHYLLAPSCASVAAIPRECYDLWFYVPH